MADVLRQQNRTGILKTPLGEDKLVLSRFDGSEGVSTLFEYRIEALSTDDRINFDDAIGRNCSLLIKSANGEQRIFDGILTETQWLGVRDHLQTYRLVLRPWFWLLSQRSDNFIFHKKKVVDIIKEVFARHSFAVYKDLTYEGNYPEIEYCVQYRESDLAFVCRLMERFGISYYFAHKEGEHKLVLVDSNDTFPAAPGGSRRYIPLTGQDRRSEEIITHWIPERRFTSGRVVLRDYNFKKPTAKMESEYSGDASYEHAGQEVYDYPGKYDEQPDGTRHSTYLLQEEEGQDKRCLANGNAITLFPGCLMSLTEHPTDYNKEYVLMSAQHSFISQQYRSGIGVAGDHDYDGQYEFLDSAIPFRPPVVTRKPLVHGLQTAFVVGAKGEEIDVDEYGRILVRFHWDRKKDQSMRCRVAQNWAYKQWGGMIIPRIGMEVIVEFLEGDPDRPLVTGCVYNGDNMPPYELPANKTRSTFKTRSHKAAGYNEIRFEDERSEEEVWFHAQKYHNADVEDDETWRIGGNRHKKVEKSQSEQILVDKDIEIGAEHREHIKGSMHLKVDGSHLNHVGGSRMSEVDSKVGVKAGMDQFHEAGMNFHIKAGMNVTIEAGMSITLMVGGNYISINPSGISIEGLPKVSINCSIPAPPPPPPMQIEKPDDYKGPHAKRYERSYKK